LLPWFQEYSAKEEDEDGGSKVLDGDGPTPKGSSHGAPRSTYTGPGAPPTGASMRMFSSLRFCLLLLCLRSSQSTDNNYCGTTTTTTYTSLLCFACVRREEMSSEAWSVNLLRHKVYGTVRRARPRMAESPRPCRRLRLRRARLRLDRWIMALGLGAGGGDTWRTTAAPCISECEQSPPCSLIGFPLKLLHSPAKPIRGR
jgi:hypothetical protein